MCDFIPITTFLRIWDDFGATYDDHVRLIEKREVDFLVELIEFFSLGVTVQTWVMKFYAEIA